MLAVPEIRPPLDWRRRPPGRPSQTCLHQIGDGSTASIRQEWDLAVGRGHSRRTRSALRASAAKSVLMMDCDLFADLVTERRHVGGLTFSDLSPTSDRKYIDSGQRTADGGHLGIQQLIGGARVSLVFTYCVRFHKQYCISTPNNNGRVRSG